MERNTFKLLRLFHDGKCDKFRPREQQLKTVTDLTPLDCHLLDSNHLNSHDLFKWLEEQGFTGIEGNALFI